MVNTILLSENCNRPQAGAAASPGPDPHGDGSAASPALPPPLSMRFGCATGCWFLSRRRKQILVRSYGVQERSVRIVPLGLKEPFLKAGPGPRTGDYLISHGTIAPVKNSVELARLAIEAQVPVLFVGKPFAEGDSYWEQFRQLVDNQYVRHQPHVASEAEMIGLLQQARGFVLKSRFENWSLAAHEAVACGLPLLLPDLPWARERFGSQASYFPGTGSRPGGSGPARLLPAKPHLPPPKVRLYSWREVAEILRDAYADDPPRRHDGGMKVLFYHLMPFALAHGGLQTQILQSRNALARNWASRSNSCAGRTRVRPATSCTSSDGFRGHILRAAQAKGMKVVAGRVADRARRPLPRCDWAGEDGPARDERTRCRAVLIGQLQLGFLPAGGCLRGVDGMGSPSDEGSCTAPPPRESTSSPTESRTSS